MTEDRGRAADDADRLGRDGGAEPGGQLEGEEGRAEPLGEVEDEHREERDDAPVLLEEAGRIRRADVAAADLAQIDALQQRARRANRRESLRWRTRRARRGSRPRGYRCRWCGPPNETDQHTADPGGDHGRGRSPAGARPGPGLKCARWRAAYASESTRAGRSPTSSAGTAGGASRPRCPRRPRIRPGPCSQALEAAGGLPPGGRLHHGSTVGTNAVLTRTGARVCLVTTAGFEDVLAIGRGRARRPPRAGAVADGTPRRPRRRAWARASGSARRARSSGALTDREVARVVRAVRRTGAEAVAVCLLHAVRAARARAAAGRRPARRAAGA